MTVRIGTRAVLPPAWMVICHRPLIGRKNLP